MGITDLIHNTVRTIPDFPKPGIQFKDITPLLENPELSRSIIWEIVQQFSDRKIDAIAGIESRGFLYGLPLAMELKVPFIAIRKKGKLPGETIKANYALEYGTAEIEMHVGAIKPGMNVLIHDDLLATGGTASAAASLVKMADANVAGFSFLLELAQLNGRNNLSRFDTLIKSLLSYT